MTGDPTTTFKPASSTALLVIDVQTDLFAEPNPVFAGPRILSRIEQVVSQARQMGAALIFVQDKDVAPVDSEGWQLHPNLDVRPEDEKIQKAYADAFYQTNLLETLNSRNVKRLVVVGCTTDACIDMTCRAGVRLGFDVVLVEDAHTTKDNRFLSAADSIAYYNVILDGFGSEDSVGAGKHQIVIGNSGNDLFRIDFLGGVTAIVNDGAATART